MAALDEVFSLFSKERRRFALYYLDQANGEVSIEELAKQIEKWEKETHDQRLPDDEFERVLISLEHNHLPKIDQAECVEFDREGGRVRISGMDNETNLLLSVSESLEQPHGITDISSRDFN